MRTCMDCGRLASQCDCEVMVLDIYDTEIVPGETYYENTFGEFIHPSNLDKFAIEYGDLTKKTR